ncbi:inositol monophosphatase family protein [Staphylococcus epidermidis]|jgi:inositol monophosphatase family protein|uniref:inositol-phosphate phosphatase n=6 Tax=Staphylococcus TaxID=1279 RepID=Q5HQ62_STAEQ|nr:MULTISPECIES: inositol monophosphatase family protein [Staphylococcus]EJD82229.1 inositol monophosphatase family protein [Staphylococcus epidermidis NIHLM088]AAW54081.1 inositol monophosphatase family protein [Staphylococcus epidermidis RP62A]AJP24402.1 inositol monophosphatase [Staphylococcus epidermidis]AXE41860.1 inositol monophosphatase family protein [Staphylococcus epidermidis]EGG69179.1 inositol monophosphatase family protein [Staphylococcus epidermidis VCU144]
MALYDFAKGLILEAGNKVRLMMQEELDIKTKSNPNDLVTNVDKATENYLYETILHNYPDHQVIGEEGHGHNLEYLKGVIWVIDPIDGTLNFVHQKENFAISIGIYHDGKPYAGFVYDVMKDVLYHAKVGQGAFENTHKLEMIQNTELKRSIIGINPNWLTKPILSDIFSSIVNEARSARAYGSAALEIISVAKGQLAAYLTPRLQPWDFAGGLLILNEVGGIGTNLLGDKLDFNQPNSILIANPSLHREILNHHLNQQRDTLITLHEKRFGKR